MKLVLTLAALIASSANSFAYAEEQKPNPTPVTTVTIGDKKILADRNSLTAYIFDVDAKDLSKCYNACEKAWPPILLKKDEVAVAPFGEHVRKDGSRQITLNHKPIYLYVGDAEPRETKGDGLQGVWHIILQ